MISTNNNIFEIILSSTYGLIRIESFVVYFEMKYILYAHTEEINNGKCVVYNLVIVVGTIKCIFIRW